MWQQCFSIELKNKSLYNCAKCVRTLMREITFSPCNRLTKLNYANVFNQKKTFKFTFKIYLAITKLFTSTEGGVKTRATKKGNIIFSYKTYVLVIYPFQTI